MVLAWLMLVTSPPPSQGGSRERAASTRHEPGSLKGLRRLLRLKITQLVRLPVESGVGNATGINASDCMCRRRDRRIAVLQ